MARPAVIRAFRIPPAVELHRAKLYPRGVELSFDGFERAGVSRAAGIVVIGCAVVGPVADVVQEPVGIVCRPLFAAQIRQGMTPVDECAIDARTEGKNRSMSEAGGQN